MIDLWQKVIALAISIAGILTTIYRMVFVKRKKVVFLHGCFWHRHPGCSNTRLPKSNVEFWEKKLSQNVFHDREVYKQLTQLGWEYLIIWECEMKKSNRTSLEKRIHLFMDGDKYDH